MKKTLHFILAGALLLSAVSCNNELEPGQETVNPAGPVILTATIVDETTKATVSESDGSSAFSALDAIRVFDGTATYGGTTSLGGVSAEFTMEDGFDAAGAGLAAFPSALVSVIPSASSVTFKLPSSYSYADVGGADADAAKTPVLMVAAKEAGSTSLSFKQVASLVRFRVTNCQAGVLHFTFTSDVTGTAELTSVVPGTTEITAANLSGTKSMTIAVTGVPAVAGGGFIYITLPVPVGTDPMNVQVVNRGATSVSSATLSGTAVSLERAGGRKRGVTLGTPITPEFSISATKKVSFAPGNLQATYDASAETWTWGFAANQYDRIGNAPGNTTITTEVKESTEPYAKLSESGTVDLFDWSTAYTYYGISTSNDGAYTNVSTAVFVDWGGLAIDGYAADYWRTLSWAELDYMLHTRKTSSIGSTENARFLKVSSVVGMKGLIIFPDNFEWDESRMGTAPDCNNSGGAGNGSFSSSQWAAMEAAGAVFLPSTGYRKRANYVDTSDSSYSYGCYWTNDVHVSVGPGFLWITYDSRYGSVGREYRYGDKSGIAVRLAHDL